jgi:hypothetical protein
VIEERAKADPANLETQGTLAETLYYDATCVLYLGDRQASAEGYRRCLEIRSKLVTEPNAKLPKVELMLAQARCGDHPEAARIAGELIASPPRESNIYFQAACGFALSAGAVKDKDHALAKRYTAAAIDCLKKGMQDGWSDIVSLETDPDLEPIRQAAEFKKLVGELKTRTAK